MPGGLSAKHLRAVALDVDGVLTDDGFVWGLAGEEAKRFVFADVMGVSLATRAGLTFALISGEASPLVDRYAEKLGITYVYKGIKDKAAALTDFATRTGLPLPSICFVGNDVNDLGAMALAGFSAAPSDAHPSVRSVANLVTTSAGGRGAVREVLDLILAARAAEPAPPAAEPALQRFFEGELLAHLETLGRLVREQGPVLSQITALFIEAFRRGNKLLFCGNGGSAADSQHIVAEFINRFRFDRAPLPALALTVDTSVLTCIANDSAYEQVFARQVQALAQPGDVVVGLSTSGRSPNILAALKAARARSAIAVGLTGANGPVYLAAHCDHLLAVPSTDTARIQEAHEFALHSIASAVEQAMFGADRASGKVG